MNVTPLESRIALLEDEQLVQLFIDRRDNKRIVNNIYKGRVQKVLPGLQSAFIDIGLEKAGFMHISDILKTRHMFDDTLDSGEGSAESFQPGAERPRIEQMVKDNQDIMVQVFKEPISTKGPKVTNTISLAGHFLVMVPGTNFIGVSKKTRDWQERTRVKRLLLALKPPGVGVIVRTQGLGKTEDEFREELDQLLRKWNQIRKLEKGSKAPALLHLEEASSTTTIRDLFSPRVDRVVIDDKETFREVASYVAHTMPESLSRIFLYKGTEPLFDAYRIEDEMKRSYRRKVWLPSGGYLIFDHTEAMAVVDVNTGRNVGKRNFEETLLQTNMEAAREVARQCRLRDMGGLIVIDFIDMMAVKNQAKVARELRHWFRLDRSRTKISDISEFGLVEMTRKSVRPSIINTFTETCLACEGLGRVTSKATLASEISHALYKAHLSHKLKRVVLEVSVPLADFFGEDNKKVLKNLQKTSNLLIELREVRHIAQDKFRIIDPNTKEDLTESLIS
jgi:ribonuclease G